MTNAGPANDAVPDANGGRGDDRDLVKTLAGIEGERERVSAQRTRRVVMASLGVMKDQKAGQRRNRSLALAAILVLIFVLGPLAWWTVDRFIANGRLSDIYCEFSALIIFIGAALLGSALLAGWLHRRS
ncbi:MAG TPA: hypothetical protein VFI20_03700 [Terracidiphilus sp.]|nr:hypothetical protein [Terracidiphilus sp.]